MQQRWPRARSGGHVVRWPAGAFTTRDLSLLGTTTAVDLVFDRNSVTQLTLGSLLGTFAGALVATTGFGCNGAGAQTAYASGGAQIHTATLAGYGFVSAAEMNAKMTLLDNIRLALVADGILS
jgi:hypothetical protein